MDSRHSRISSKNAEFLGIGGEELISDPKKLYQALKLTLLGKTKDPKPMAIGNPMNMYELCNFDDPDFVLLFLCNPDVLKYTSDTVGYTL